MEQRTPEWYSARCGKVGASDIADLMAQGRGGGYSASRERLMWVKIAERRAGKMFDGFQSQAMLDGIEREPMAREAYAWKTGMLVVPAGWVAHPDFADDAGCSPDGLVGADGLVEIKCPAPHTHAAFIYNRNIDDKYLLQMQWQMAVTNRQWCDFVSFHPDFETGDDRIQIRRVPRNDGTINKITGELDRFLEELKARMNHRPVEL